MATESGTNGYDNNEGWSCAHGRTKCINGSQSTNVVGRREWQRKNIAVVSECDNCVRLPVVSFECLERVIGRPLCFDGKGNLGLFSCNKGIWREDFELQEVLSRDVLGERLFRFRDTSVECKGHVIGQYACSMRWVAFVNLAIHSSKF
jgi:hypothetical protein